MKRKLIAGIIGAVIIFSGCSEKLDAPKETVTSEIKTVNLLESPIYVMNDPAPETSEEDYILTQDEIELIALLTMAEAEDECENGKRLVIDTVLNRVDSELFPNSVAEVIFEPYQFPSMVNGRAERCEIRSDICDLVKEEFIDRTNDECLYFNPGGYPPWGEPLFRVQNHYFSGEENIDE